MGHRLVTPGLGDSWDRRPPSSEEVPNETGNAPEYSEPGVTGFRKERNSDAVLRYAYATGWEAAKVAKPAAIDGNRKPADQ